jgi:hypothetical protein
MAASKTGLRDKVATATAKARAKVRTANSMLSPHQFSGGARNSDQLHSGKSAAGSYTPPAASQSTRKPDYVGKHRKSESPKTARLKDSYGVAKTGATATGRHAK